MWLVFTYNYYNFDNTTNGSMANMDGNTPPEMSSGSNGENVTLNLKNQNVSGNIVVDSISTLEMSLSNSSYYEGVINSSKDAKSITLKLSKNSKIKLLGDSYVTILDDEDSSYGSIDFNGYKLYVNGVAIN